ncbi:MAG: alanine--glyoxylate aminotransferase family protein [SAR202 cluster bacterium]|nr:alanine--glyoxylate aminotransferase family protein [SAR202 cluster bacterium]
MASQTSNKTTAARLAGENLRIPGPVPLPDDILEAVGTQMMNHRGPEYADMLARMTANLKTVFMTAGDAYFITSSGTGAMEAAIVNTLSPGDKVLSLTIGFFGDRFGDIAKAYGANVVAMQFPAGQPVDVFALKAKLKAEKDVRAVIVTHNESSTGVANPLKDIAHAVKENSGALVLVDAVSSAAAMPIAVDAWGIDVVATASQKAWIAPPGIAMITFSAGAWKAYQTARMPKYYYDVAQYRDFLKIGQPPFTPCLPAMYALEVSLQRIVDEGIESVFERHHRTADRCRNGAEKLGLKLFPERRFASDTVTAIRVPDGIDGKALVARVRKNYGAVIGGGQGQMTGKIVRVGHMGWVETNHVDSALEAIGKSIAAMRAGR